MYDNNYNNYGQQDVALQSKVSHTMRRVYLKMTLALIVTALTSLWAASSHAYLSFLLTHSWLMWVLIIAEFGIVIGISAGISKLSNMAATGLFYLFAVVNGLMLCTIFLTFDPTVIFKTFMITAGTFGAMTIYGYFTDSDLTSFGKYLFFGLIGLIIASVVNIFLHSNTLEWVVSIVGVLVFIGLTAWDTQQIKRMALAAPADSVSRLATLGALSLYLDFINLFLYLLRIFGNRD